MSKTVEPMQTHEKAPKKAATSLTAVSGQKEGNGWDIWNIKTKLVMSVDNGEFIIVFRIKDPETMDEKKFQFCSLQGK